MYCSQCGTAIAENAKFCGNCGTSIQVAPRTNDSVAKPSPKPSAVPASEAGAAQVRPWVRYWARMFDIYLVSLVVVFALGIFYPDAFNSDALNENTSDQLFGILIIFVWVFIESLFLSTVGTTPGKWLFKIRLISPSGDKPDFSAALSRSFKVWRGLGIGFPLVSLFTLIVAHRNLTKNGVTTWDKDDGFSVTHDRIGPLRVIFAIIFFLGFLALIVLGSMDPASFAQ